MARLIPNDFQEYAFDTEAELRSAMLLTESNIQFIKTQLASVMTERANLEYDVMTPITSFVQQEAALKGQINAYQFLLDSHKAATDLNSSVSN